VRQVSQLLDRISILIGKFIAPMTLIMMILTCIVVVARYLFNVGAIPLQETVVYLHGTVFMLGIGFTLQQSGHVRVDIIYQRFPPRVQALVNLVGSVIFLIPVSMFIFWTSLDYVALSWRLSESSAEPGGLPFVYLLKTLIPAMSLLLFLQGVAEILRSLLSLLGREVEE